MSHPGLGPDPEPESAGDRALRLRAEAESATRYTSEGLATTLALLALEARLASIEGRLAQLVRKS